MVLVYGKEGKVGMGFLLRDQKGKFLTGKAESAHVPMDAMTVEALSCRAALLWIGSNNICKVFVETDCLLLPSAINNPGSYYSSLSLIIQDCKDMVRAIPECLNSFVRLLANYAAHLLSRSAGSESGHGEWVTSFFCQKKK